MFTFKSLAHFFASVAHDVKIGADAAAKFCTANKGAIETTASIATEVISLADPALAPLAQSIDRAGEAVLGEVFAALSKFDTAVNAPMNVSFDAAAVAELKALFEEIKGIKGLAAVPPAALTK